MSPLASPGSFDVQCRSTARSSSASLMPAPSSLTMISALPPSRSTISILRAPASIAFSTSSLTAAAGRSMTSPAAMRLTTTGGRRRIFIGLFYAITGSLGMRIAEPQGQRQTAQAQTARRNQIPRGIAYMVASTVMFAGVNAIVKWELETYPIGEVAFFRSLFAFLAVAAMILPRAGLAVLRTRRYREHLQRGLSQFGSMTCMFVAFSDAVARLGDRDQLLGAAVHDLAVDPDPEGEGRRASLVGAAPGVCRRAGDHAPGRRGARITARFSRSPTRC